MGVADLNPGFPFCPFSDCFILVQGIHSDASALRKTTVWREASRVVKEEGFRVFWKGNLVTIAHRLPYSSISFYAFKRYKNVVTAADNGSGESWEKYKHILVHTTGTRWIGWSGITAASVTYPLDIRNVIYYRAIAELLDNADGECIAFPLPKIRFATSAGVTVAQMGGDGSCARKNEGGE
ncbi:hypothetical protein L1987_64799 [Smallanthus sonchifolius]|uniref:Uncharacterized protein n=1 Tax=Smallanthus sonchifolius TaxID=185202 RepID=A0ACB9BSJ8_9ASTR|nr:hypothetical protein L1987_64799 [Smallanthus sonchifolius]